MKGIEKYWNVGGFSLPIKSSRSPSRILLTRSKCALGNPGVFSDTSIIRKLMTLRLISYISKKDARGVRQYLTSECRQQPRTRSETHIHVCAWVQYIPNTLL